MHNRKLLVFSAILLIFSLGCGLTGAVNNLIGGGKNDVAVNGIWPDVPLMGGMDQTKLDLPLPARLAFEGLVKSNTNGKGNLQFIAYTTASSLTDITNFYTVDKMTAAGWTEKDQAGCQGTTSNSSNGGAICFFGKQNPSDSTASYLVLFIGQDSSSGKTSVFFIRVDGKNLPTQTP